jgi:Protein of unknown function (DUF4199)
MALKDFDWKTLIAIGLIAGLIQAGTGIAMYLAGVYFASWSIFVSLFVLLLCVVVGTRWYRDSSLQGQITYGRALMAGIVISVCTGVVYAVYNFISISYVYAGFLENLITLNVADVPASQQTPELIATMRERVTVNTIALSNLIRLAVLGTILSVFASLVLKRKQKALLS